MRVLGRKKDGGCGVVYRRNDGKMIITTGVQGDFGYFS